MTALTPIDTVDQALDVMAYLAGWSIPADSADPYVVQVCYAAALQRTEGLALSRARLLQAKDVVEAYGVVVTR
ncbi:MAG TPA: hypothetical protein VIQ30_00175 [Pseudonocardia sp.]